MRKALVAAVLGSLLLLVSPAPAYAHADLVRSTPTNGSVVAKTPSSIRLTFNEAVTIDSAEILDSAGATVPSTAAMNGAILTLTPTAPLRAGITTTAFAVTSDDGHQIEGAIAFVIGKPGARGAAQLIVTSPSIATRLNGSRPGALTLAFASKSASGEVVWTSPTFSGSLTWPVRARGKASESSGVLPFTGVWTMRATLISAKGSVVITSGTATLNP
jgi:methionine-rich copper-binding protein CopC